MPRLRLIFLVLVLGAWAPIGTGPGPGVGTVTKLPVPRFVTLRADTVNVRAGPGFQYPVTWIYKRDGLPVEIIGEFGAWRQITAPDGGTGWVHEATIRARRGFFVTAPKAALHASPDAGSRITAWLDQSVSGTLLACPPGDFCRVATEGAAGYLERADFWGTFPAEVVK